MLLNLQVLIILRQENQELLLPYNLKIVSLKIVILL
jgi:hypothetical protein